jgi:hypothetical protein
MRKHRGRPSREVLMRKHRDHPQRQFLTRKRRVLLTITLTTGTTLEATLLTNRPAVDHLVCPTAPTHRLNLRHLRSRTAKEEVETVVEVEEDRHLQDPRQTAMATLLPIRIGLLRIAESRRVIRSLSLRCPT